MKNMDNYEQFDGYLPGSDEAEMETLLDELGELDRASAPSTLEAGVLDAVARAIAPAPIALTQPAARRLPMVARFAIAAAIMCVASVGVLMMRSTPALPTQMGSQSDTLAVSLEADVESLLALEEIEHELDHSFASWSLQAQAIDSDLNSGWVALDLMDSSLDENGAL
jgi:hypothetical protein